MENITILSRGINVMPLLLGLKRHPQLWNTRTARTERVDSPHRDVDDIWVRYHDGSYSDSLTPHHSVWLEAADLLPEAKAHARAIMSTVGGDELGGILITRIPSGKQVLPHQDLGWHARYYDKFALQIESHQQQAFCFEEGQLVTAPGDLYWFNNQQSHWVINDSPVPRVTMIVCVKLDKPFGGV
jgi:hypothetical protein